MTKSFTLNDKNYLVREVSAVAGCVLDTRERQDALLVTNKGYTSSEKFDYVVFGWSMPETEEDFAEMCEDSSAWESDEKVIKTVQLRETVKSNPKTWYAVICDETNGYKEGSYDLYEAKQIAKDYDDAYIAVIKDGIQAVVIGEIRNLDEE